MAENCWLTISEIRSSSRMVILEVDGIGSARITRLSEVMVETWKLMTLLNMLYVGVGRPFASTPSHWFPMKKFSLTDTWS